MYVACILVFETALQRYYGVPLMGCRNGSGGRGDSDSVPGSVLGTERAYEGKEHEL